MNANPESKPPAGPRHQPFVPESVSMKEFTPRAVILGLLMTLVLGAANAYLGLRAGVTIAATYPAAVIGMAFLRLRRGSILEENIARTAGSIGESVAAGAIFTLPAFVIAGVWPSFAPKDAYWKSTALMLVGSVLGVLFVSLVRRVMVEDRELPFPESVAASEIHKAGQSGASAAKYLFYSMGFGALVYVLGVLRLFAPDKDLPIRIGTLGTSQIKLGAAANAPALAAGGASTFAAPSVSPAYLGVGYIIGPELAALNFSGGVLAWGFMVPLLMFLLGPQLQHFLPAGTDAANPESWATQVGLIWRFIVRPIAVGGMLVGAAYTLYKMRKNLFGGLGRAFAELKGKADHEATVGRTERYMSSRTVFSLIAVVFGLMIVLYLYMTGLVIGAIVAAIVMLVAGFFFATVSGYLVGLIGSSNNPISGLTLSTLIIAALLMVSLGVSGASGVVAVLGVAAVVCVSSAVAGELLQDFKVGYILGGTPRTIQIVELIAVVCASLVMYFPVMILHFGNIKSGGIGFGDPKLPAPQAGLMAALAQGIVGGNMPWALVAVGVLMGIAMILLKVRSPMLVAVGMYLPLATTFAIFVGGMIRGLTDMMRERKGFNEAQKARVENVGVLVASGLIAGEALVGLATATFNFFNWPLPSIFESPSYIAGLVVMAILAFVLVRVPLANAGSPDEPAPPVAMM
ncbi:MAG: oligopeptide transporter, OPT family [Thermoanaerobaculia bacterium]